MLSTRKLSFSYKTRKNSHLVFRDLNIDFKPGFNVILGPNGAGKSTLLKAMFGLLKYDGHIYYREKDLASISLDEKTQLMSYLPQIDVNSSSLSVLEMVLLGLLPELGRQVSQEAIDKVVATLKLLNIGDLASRRFSNLSGGQKKMVFIAQTLVRDPEVILLDEPTNSLDLQRQMELFHVLSRLSRENISIILVLHDINLAARFADHIVVIDKFGKLYGQGQAKDIITQAMLREVYGVVASLHYDQDKRPLVSVLGSVNNMEQINKNKY